MKIFNGFLIIVAAVMLLMLPVTTSVYAFQTDVREETFNVDTAGGLTTGNVTLHKAVYDDDTSTISLASDISEVPTFVSYNTTSRNVAISNLTASENRTITVSYDTAAIVDSDAINTLLSKVPLIWLLMIIAFPVVALIAVAKEWF